MNRSLTPGRWSMRGVARTALLLSAFAAGLAGGPPGAAAAPPSAAAPLRVEAHSPDWLAVGLVHEDKMSIHVSRSIDNAPLRDAVVTVVLRGAAHPTIAEADGSYTLQSQDLLLPGTAAVEFQVAQGGAQEVLKGALDVVGTGQKTEDKNNARQLWWWVLNFAVCIGFLLLISRRKKAAEA